MIIFWVVQGKLLKGYDAVTALDHLVPDMGVHPLTKVVKQGPLLLLVQVSCTKVYFVELVQLLNVVQLVISAEHIAKYSRLLLSQI